MDTVGASLKRVVLLCSGVICLALGIAGAVLPLLPTTPFVLLASACFMKSSPRLNQKLRSNATFGPIIDHWQTHRGMHHSVKRKAYLFIVLSFALSITVVPLMWVKCLLGTMMVILLTWLYRLPEPTQ
nr:YbaN family protein [Vibrio rarus]